MRRAALILLLLCGIACDTAPAPSPSALEPSLPMHDQPPTTFDALFTKYVISSFDKQLLFADLHVEGDWDFNKSRGEITFSGSPAYSIQVLGTEDHVNRSWLWGWANKASGFPDETLRAARELQTYGQKHNVTELTEAKLSLDDIDGHTIGLVAAGFCDAKAYYRCPYENGALFVLITDDKLSLADTDIIRATVVIPQAIAAVEIQDQRAAIATYLHTIGFEYELDDGKLVVAGADRGKSPLVAEFDAANRLTNLEGQLTPKNLTPKDGP